MSKAAAVMVGRTRNWVSKAVAVMVGITRSWVYKAAAAVMAARSERPSATFFSVVLFLLSAILWLLRDLAGGGGKQ